MSRLLSIVVIVCIGCVAEPSHRAVPGEVGADGSLRFANADEFFAAVDAVGRMTDAQLDRWEQAIGFRSMRRGFDELEVALATATGDARAKLLADNADLIDGQGDEPARRVRAHGYASLIDRRGMFQVQGVLHKVTADQVLTSRDPDPAHLDAHGPGSKAHALRYTEANQILGGCGDFFSGDVTTSDRRERYALQAMGYLAEDLGGVQYRYAAEFRFGGEKRFLGSWTSYNTTYQLYEVDIDMDVLRLTGFNGQQSTYDYVRQRFQLPDWDSAEAAHVTLTAWVGDTIINPASEPSWPSFERVHMETTSRGTFPTRGVIECGFCGDSTCDPIRHETPGSCTADCGFCGDGICWFGEDHNNCGQDCRPPPVCGDGICDSEEMWTGCWDCPPPCFAAKC